MGKLGSFADLNNAFSTFHGVRTEESAQPTDFLGFKEAPVLSNNNNNNNRLVDLEEKRKEFQDPDGADWYEVPVDFRTFCESSEHLNLLPKK